MKNPPAQGDAQPRDAEKELTAAQVLLSQLIRLPEMEDIFHPDMRPNTRMVYTNGVTFWLLILQRLGKGLSLSEVVLQVLKHERDLLPDNKRVREHTLSENSSAYSQARQRLSLDVIEDFSHRVCDYLGRTSPPVFDSRRVFILDGTTITLPPTPKLKKAFPPAPNQHGTSVWPVAMLMVANELQSGCALLPQIDPMYGENNSSESAQARQIIGRLPEHSIVMADSGFGIFSVAHYCTAHGHDFLFRMNKARFKALRRQGALIDEGPTHRSYAVRWTPSYKVRASHPELPQDAVIDVVVHEVTLPDGSLLYLVSSLEIDAASAAELYRRRYDVEFDIRDMKVTMDTENIQARSVDMVLKELMTSVVAYNLVAQFRRQSATLASLHPRQLSFKGVWITFRHHLLLQQPVSFDEWLRRYAAALVSGSQRKHPNRKAPRTCPRVAHPRRQKSTKFQKSQRSKSAPDEQPPPSTEPK